MAAWSAALWDAAQRGEYATVLRLAREERGWSQDELAAKFGCSASTISRFETGRRTLRDVAVLRRLADLLDLPAEAFGLTPPQHGRHGGARRHASASKVAQQSAREGDDPVRRRAFLLATGVTGATVIAPQAPPAEAVVDPAAFLMQRLENVLVLPGATESPSAPLPSLRTALAAARQDFQNCHYVQLASRLPSLITTAEVTHRTIHEPASATVLAQTYNLATRALIKLDSSGLEWITADRALRTAGETSNPLVLAEAQRLLGSACRRAGHHERARIMTLAAAQQLDLTSNNPDPDHLHLYGVLMCSAGYAAARAGDHNTATELLNEATNTATRLADHPTHHIALTTNIISHRVSTLYLLGNGEKALHHAKKVRLGDFPNIERRARFLVDIALCYAQSNKPSHAYHTLLTAERTAPGEIRTRATVRRLITDLLHHPHQAALRGLPNLATRTNALT